MIYFKACPRCKGDVSVTSDRYGRYWECLQCGYEAEEGQSPHRSEAVRTEKDKVVAGAA